MFVKICEYLPRTIDVCEIKYTLHIKLRNIFYLDASRNLITGLAEASNVRIIKISPRSDQAPTNTLMQHRPLPSTQYAN